MKEVKEEIKREVVDVNTYYEAIDGTKFTNKEECVKYEDTVCCVLLARAKAFAIATEEEQSINPFNERDDNNYIMLLPQKKEDIDTLNQLYVLPRKAASAEPYFTKEHIGKPILMGYRLYENNLEWSWFNDMQKVINVMTNGKFELKPKSNEVLNEK